MIRNIKFTSLSQKKYTVLRSTDWRNNNTVFISIEIKKNYSFNKQTNKKIMDTVLRSAELRNGIVFTSNEWRKR